MHASTGALYDLTEHSAYQYYGLPSYISFPYVLKNLLH